MYLGRADAVRMDGGLAGVISLRLATGRCRGRSGDARRSRSSSLSSSSPRESQGPRCHVTLRRVPPLDARSEAALLGGRAGLAACEGRYSDETRGISKLREVLAEARDLQGA